MIILNIETALNKRVILTQERWNHIISRHPEMNEKLNEIEETLQTPDYIILNETSFVYQKRKQNYITVVLDKRQNFIITAFLSTNIKKGEKIWTA